VTVFTRGKASFSEEQKEKLNRHDIEIIETEISELKHENGQVKSLLLDDGKEIDFDAFYASFPFQQHSDIAENLGCELTERGHIKTDHAQKTNIPGVFVCGDNSSMTRSVSSAIMTGNVAGAVVNMELATENF
jgi:thioredoxin reductase